MAPHVGRRPSRAVRRGRQRRYARRVPPRMGARVSQLPPVDRSPGRAGLPRVRAGAARIRRHARSAAPPLLVRGLRRLGRRLPRRRRRRGEGVAHGPLLRRRRRHQDRAPPPEPRAHARAHQLGRRLVVAVGLDASRRSASVRCGTGVCTFRRTSGRSRKRRRCCRSSSKKRCPTCCATRARSGRSASSPATRTSPASSRS